MTCIRAAACITALLCLLTTAAVSAAEPVSPSIFIGQWIWSRQDVTVYRDSCRSVPALVPSVWVGTVGYADGKITQKIANDPCIAGTSVPVAIVIRFDDSFHGIWDARKPDDIAIELDGRLDKLMELVGGSGADVREVQLDYDCPVRRLDMWSKTVKALAAGSLSGKEIWVTSLPSHLEDPVYASYFDGVVAGHIIQVFDTGVCCDRATVGRLTGALRRQGMDFRVGIGAFERRKASLRTDHRLWFSAIPDFSSIPGFRGLWIFPGGMRWASLI